MSGAQRLITTASIVSFLLAGCGQGFQPHLISNLNYDDIINGQVSSAGDYPAVGAILAVGIMGDYGVGSMTCTGTLIAPDVVLTAGHCTENPFPDYTNEFMFFFSFSRNVKDFGVDSLELPPATFPVAAVGAHPQWSMANVDAFTGGLSTLYDIAVMVLDRPVTGVTPAVLMEADDSADVVRNATVEIAGYGMADPDDMASAGVMYHATTKINEVGTTEMQIGNLDPTARKCHGDSGGPSFMQVDDGKDPLLRLVGVTSHAYDASDCYKGGVDTRVNPYLDWIKEILVAACDQGYRTDCAQGGLLTAPIEPTQTDPTVTPSSGDDQPPVETGPSGAGDQESTRPTTASGSDGDNTGAPAAETSAPLPGAPLTEGDGRSLSLGRGMYCTSTRGPAPAWAWAGLIWLGRRRWRRGR